MNDFQVKGMVASLWVVSDCFGGIIGSPIGSLTFDNWGMGISTGHPVLPWINHPLTHFLSISDTGLEAAGLLISVILLGLYSIGKNCKQKPEQTDQSQVVR